MSQTSTKPDAIAPNFETADGSADDDPGPSLNILSDCGGWASLGNADGYVARAYEACLHAVPSLNGREVTVLLSSDDAVAALNAAYRGKNKPTNVLSFPAGPAQGRSAPSPLGDIIIAYDTVLREAQAENKAPLEHLAHLTVHGLLHLAGFSHDTDAEAEQMEAMERNILSGIGIPDPYPTFEDETLTSGR